MFVPSCESHFPAQLLGMLVLMCVILFESKYKSQWQPEYSCFTNCSTGISLDSFLGKYDHSTWTICSNILNKEPTLVCMFSQTEVGPFNCLITIFNCKLLSLIFILLYKTFPLPNKMMRSISWNLLRGPQYINHIKF